MPIKIRTDDKMKYVPLDCREDDNPSYITMRRVPPLKSAKIKDTMYKVEGTKVTAGNLQTSRTRMVLEAMVGWGNIVDENGSEVKFDASNKEQMFGFLPQELQDELVAVFGNGVYDAKAEERLANPDEDDENEDDDLAAELAAEEESLSEEGTIQ